MPDIIVISDVHASDRWRQMAARRAPGDEVIFLGDYFDRRGHGPFARSQVDNFIDICEYATANPMTTLLLGNHDYNYTPWALSDMSYMPDANAIAKALMARLDLLQVVAVRPAFVRPLIFSHGGLTSTFMKLHDIEKPEDVNLLWLEQPEEFEWIPADPVSGARSNRYGDDPWQSPIWVRDNALYEDAVPGYDQVVGHTPVEDLATFQTKNGDTILMTCTLDDRAVIIDPDSPRGLAGSA